MAYTTIPESTATGVGAGWFATNSADITDINPLLTEIPVAIECISVTTDVELSSAGGTGALSVPAFDGGAIQLTTGANANSFVGFQNKGGSSNPIVLNSVTSDWAVAGRFKITTTADAQTRLELLGITDTVADIGLHVLGSTSTVNYVLLVRGVSNTVVNTTVAFDTAMHTHWIIKTGSTLSWYLDGVLQSQTLTDFSQAGSTAAYTRIAAVNGTTAAARTFVIDKYMVMTQAGT